MEDTISMMAHLVTQREKKAHKDYLQYLRDKGDLFLSYRLDIYNLFKINSDYIHLYLIFATCLKKKLFSKFVLKL